MGKKLEVKFITASNEKGLQNDLKIFATENPDITIDSTSHVVSHFEPRVHGYNPERTEKHYYTIWYSK